MLGATVRGAAMAQQTPCLYNTYPRLISMLPSGRRPLTYVSLSFSLSISRG